jgi:hypothetical protein
MADERNRKMPKDSKSETEVGEEKKQALQRHDLRTIIERKIEEMHRKRQQAKLEKQILSDGSEEATVEPLIPGINDTSHSSQLVANEVVSDVSDDYSRHDQGGENGGEICHHFSNSADVLALDRDMEDELTHGNEHDVGENLSEPPNSDGLGHDIEDNPTHGIEQSTQTAVTHPSMTPQEKEWWAMSFEELFEHAKSKNFGKSGKESRKSGRVRIIKWLCEKAGIKPYVVSFTTPIGEASTSSASPEVRRNGAISHPEVIVRTSNPTLQSLIEDAERKYKEWPHADLLALAMQRSYQLLKDSHGKLPSKSKSALAKWLAAWDVLKSPREKKWWLGDGIDLVNKAKAMGYQGSSRKYDVIRWLRNTTEDAEVEVTQVAEPTPNRKAAKRKAEDRVPRVSKRSAKGSTRPNGWHTGI